MSRSKFLMAAFVAAAVALVAPATSQAGFKLSMKQGASGFSGYDLDLDTSNKILSVDPTGNDNEFSYTLKQQTVGEFTITLAVIVSNKPGTEAQATLDLGASKIVRTGGAANSTQTTDLILQITNTDYTLPTGKDFLLTSASANFTNAGTSAQVTVEGFADTANGEYTDTTVSPSGATVFTAGGFTLKGDGTGTPAPLQSGEFTVAGNYSLTTKITISSIKKGGEVNFANAETTVVPTPAPAGLVMLATALPFAGLLRRRFRKSEIAPVA